MSLRIHAFQIHDFVAIHLVVITADNLNACTFTSAASPMYSMLKMVSERLFLGIVCCYDAFCKICY